MFLGVNKNPATGVLTHIECVSGAFATPHHSRAKFVSCSYSMFIRNCKIKEKIEEKNIKFNFFCNFAV